MKYKMLALDIDGTILNSKRQISEKTKDSIKRVCEKNIRVMLVSGRLHWSMKNIAKELDLNTDIISLNGAVIHLANEDKIIKEDKIDQMDYERLIASLEEQDFELMAFDKDNIYSKESFIRREFINKLSKRPVKILDTLLHLKNPIKVTIVGGDESKLSSVYDDLDKDKFTMIKTGYDFVEIINKQTNKWNSILEVSKIYGIKEDEIIAIGDSENDIEMISESGLGIAMGNAYENVKLKSDYITKTCDEDGVSFAIDKFILSEKEF